MHSREGPSFDEKDFTLSRFFMCFDCEKAAAGPGGGAEFTGMSTRGGETLRFEGKQLTTSDADTAPKKFYMHLHVNVILNLKLEGAELFD